MHITELKRKEKCYHRREYISILRSGYCIRLVEAHPITPLIRGQSPIDCAITISFCEAI